MKFNHRMLLLGCGVLIAGLITVRSNDVVQAATPRSRIQPTTQPTQTANNIKLLGYGLFLIHIGLKPFETAQQGDLKLSKRMAKASPLPQGQHQSID